MKKILFVLLPLLAGPSAFSSEVGDVVHVDRSQIKCKEGKPSGCRRGGYGYCDYGYPDGSNFTDAVAEITATVEGVSNLRATLVSCGVLNSLLDYVGNPVPLEVSQINIQKLSGGLVMRYLTLSVGSSEANQIRFQGSKQQ